MVARSCNVFFLFIRIFKDTAFGLSFVSPDLEAFSENFQGIHFKSLQKEYIAYCRWTINAISYVL